ncbi:hypothetical protein [Pedobacter cryophilus]|uniref:CopG family transcriptional regulator n=1 Tax=Pedobacter cryophilus TaxID=2571271 RepID=A0A4U1C984_9SPHI|nr:hypothetical protein [Pedobacter cryophilus]TKC00977.1 hypothetical protein FA046_04690 [Pedobacter cryophilus]
MKSILLKIEDELFNEVEKTAKEIHISKTAFIKKAVESYIKIWERKKLEKELKKEIQEIKKYDLDRVLISEFEEASLTDLQKHLNE